jgi:hypothetical protein
MYLTRLVLHIANLQLYLNKKGKVKKLRLNKRFILAAVRMQKNIMLDKK